MKKRNLLFLVLAFIFVFTLSGTGAWAADDTIVIGVISPNTGALAAYGIGISTGADLAVEEINAAGGILGRQVELIHTDDQSDPTECLNAFNSLVAKGVQLIVGSATSGCTSAITDAANEEEVCILSPTATADSLTTEDDYIFRACYADSFQGAIAAAYAKQAGFERVGVVYCAADVYSKGLFPSPKPVQRTALRLQPNNRRHPWMFRTIPTSLTRWSTPGSILFMPPIIMTS